MIRLAVRVAAADAELALAELLVLSPAGVEEVEIAPGVIEYALYGAAGELPTLPDLRAAAGSALVDVSTREVADDWAQRWQQFHTPVTVKGPSGARGDAAVHVRPPWAPAVAQTGVVDVVIDPGQAFGTGAHPSTRLCLELLLEVASGGAAGGAARDLVDVGCGSGVLAIAAACLGFSPVRACDHDPLSVSATVDNARANDVVLEVSRCDVRCQSPPPGTTMTANLLRPLLLDLLGVLESPPRTLIAGGLLASEADEVAGAYDRAHGLRERGRRDDGEWAALLLERPPG